MKIINKLGSEIQVGDKILDFAQGLIFKVNKIEPFPDHVLTGVVDEFNTHTAVVKLDERSAAKGFGKTMYPSLSRLTVIEG